MADHEAKPQNGTTGDEPRITVLLVDDQRFVGLMLERLLAKEPDIDLHCCLNPAEAVARATEIAATVIFQDLVLGDIDGLTMVRLFRANPPTAHVPVIVLSANDDGKTRARAFAEGASDYLVKLPSKSDLIACIRRHAGPAGAVHPGAGKAASQ